MVLELILFKLSYLINAYDYKATNQCYYPDLSSCNVISMEFLGSLLRRLFRELSEGEEAAVFSGYIVIKSAPFYPS